MLSQRLEKGAVLLNRVVKDPVRGRVALGVSRGLVIAAYVGSPGKKRRAGLASAACVHRPSPRVSSESPGINREGSN